MAAILGYQLYQSNSSNKALTIKVNEITNERDSLLLIYGNIHESHDSIVYVSTPGRKIIIRDSFPYPIYAGDTNTYKRVYEESSVTDDYAAKFKIGTIGTLDFFDWEITDYNDTIKIPYPIEKEVVREVTKNAIYLTVSTRVPTLRSNRYFDYLGIGAQYISKKGYGIGVQHKVIIGEKPIQEVMLLWNPFQKMN